MSDQFTVAVPRGFRGSVTVSIEGPPDQPVEPQVVLSEDEVAAPESPVEDHSSDPVMRSPVTVHGFQGHPLKYCGHTTPLAHLEALHSLVRSKYRGELFQAVVLNEWTGESSYVISEATDGAASVYAISDWLGRTAEQYEVSQRDGEEAVMELCRLNALDRVKLLRADPITAAEKAQHPAYDLVFLNSEEQPAVLNRLVELWSLLLKPDGIIAGQAVTEDEQNAVAQVFKDKLHTMPDSSLWWYPKSEVPGE